MNTKNQINLFYSYAEADAELRDELDKHLSSLRREGCITQWYNRNISAGTEWASQINQHLNTAHIILLLISSDFLASDYCYSVEMKRALERHSIGEARVIPILLRYVDWQHAPFAELQVLPQDARPVKDWPDRDWAFSNIALALRKVVEELQAAQRDPSPHQQDAGQNNTPSVPQTSRTNDQFKQNMLQAPPQSPQAPSQFSNCQEKVSELKNVHNMLHEIEVQLEGLSDTIQLMPSGRTGQTEEINHHLSSSDYREIIEISWQRTAPKIEDLAYFATEEMKTLEQERFSIANNVISGPAWVTDLVMRQQAFETEVRSQNIIAIKTLSKELLTICRYHLYRIDRRLLTALKELDAASNLIVKERI